MSRKIYAVLITVSVLKDDTDQSKDDAKSSTGISRFESKSKCKSCLFLLV